MKECGECKMERRRVEGDRVCVCVCVYTICHANINMFVFKLPNCGLVLG